MIGYIYKIACKDPDITDIYIGSTRSIRNRRTCHKSTCGNPNARNFNIRVYQYIRDHGGWDNWEMIVVETHEYQLHYELQTRERHYFELLHATLNVQVPNRSMAEYYRDTFEVVSAQRKQHRIDNPELTKAQDKIIYKRHIEKINRKINCECGGKYTYANKSNHLKTQIHNAR
jgi:hypothetical protein